VYKKPDTIDFQNMAKMYHGIEIESQPEKVFEAIGTQKGLSGWWTADSVLAKAGEGGVGEFGFNNRAVVFKMRIDKLVTSKLILWKCVDGPKKWKGTRLRWQITKIKGGSDLQFTHSKWKATDGDFRMCNSTWGHLMYRLKDYVETGEPDPLFR
jgi:uncharacterized protein YndB with AHSA1/START domain